MGIKAFSGYLKPAKVISWETAEGDPDPAVWTEITERVADRRHGARVGFTGALARVFIKCETVKLASRENPLVLIKR